MKQAIVFAATTEDAMYFKVGGRATFACCTELRDYAQQLLQGTFKHVSVDLEDCTGMDSTFMGLLAMLANDRLHKNGASVKIVKATAPTKGLLRELGLTNLLDFSDDPIPDVDWHEIYPVDESKRPAVISMEGGRLMLQAHKALMEVSEGNVEKFKDVVDSLESEIGD